MTSTPEHILSSVSRSLDSQPKTRQISYTILLVIVIVTRCLRYDHTVLLLRLFDILAVIGFFGDNRSLRGFREVLGMLQHEPQMSANCDQMMR